jgi:hypothetical protein
MLDNNLTCDTTDQQSPSPGADDGVTGRRMQERISRVSGVRREFAKRRGDLGSDARSAVAAGSRRDDRRDVKKARQFCTSPA